MVSYQYQLPFTEHVPINWVAFSGKKQPDYRKPYPRSVVCFDCGNRAYHMNTYCEHQRMYYGNRFPSGS